MIPRRSIAALAAAALAAATLAGCAAPRPKGPRMQVTEPAIEATVASPDGVAIHYRAEGSGSPAVVLVHGFAMDGDSWREQVDALAAHHRVVTLDLAGHGRSGDNRYDWTVEAFAGDVVAVCDALQLRSVVLVGHSMGAQVALAAAPRLGARLWAIVAVDSLHDETQAPDDAAREAFLAPFRTDYAKAADAFARGLFAPGADPALVARVAERFAAVPPERAIAILDAVWRWDSAAAMRRLAAPLVAINSDQHPTNVEGNRTLAQGFDAVILTGVGHFPQLERPAEFDAALESVLARWTPPPPPPPASPAPTKHHS